LKVQRKAIAAVPPLLPTLLPSARSRLPTRSQGSLGKAPTPRYATSRPRTDSHAARCSAPKFSAGDCSAEFLGRRILLPPTHSLLAHLLSCSPSDPRPTTRSTNLTMSGVGYHWPALAQQAFMAGTCRNNQSIVRPFTVDQSPPQQADTGSRRSSRNGAPSLLATDAVARSAQTRPSPVRPLRAAEEMPRHSQRLTIEHLLTGPGTIIACVVFPSLDAPAMSWIALDLLTLVFALNSTPLTSTPLTSTSLNPILVLLEQLHRWDDGECFVQPSLPRTSSARLTRCSGR
jgi:hypothetical protein